MRLLVRACVAIGAALVLTATLAAPAAAQITTGSIRGRIISSAGQPVDAAEITALNVATGTTQRTLTDADGRYRFPALQVGTYRIEARRIGFRAVERPGILVRLGGTVVADFQLTEAAAVLEAITVVGVAEPMIDPDQSGVVDLVSAEQVEAIPVNGRNFADLVALSPKVGVDVGDGTGGALSLGGGRRGANLIQIDGAGTTGTFFGGEARGSDRIPFAFSIESVREFQIVTNGFDVEYGFFSGGVINAVTKSGTNELHGSLFGFFRDDKITRNDFFDREPDFSSRQIGGTVSGPLLRDKLHFFVAVERQDRDEPVFGLPSPLDTPDVETQRVHPDSVQRFLDILRNVYGVSDSTGQFQQNQDEWAIFGRLDWQINNSNRLTLRHNYTKLEQRGDRINPDETFLNGGVFNNTGNSTVLELNSVITPNVWNQVRAQVAFEPRPREANTFLPESEVNVNSDFDGDGSTDQSLNGLECCNDAVLPNNLEETTLELTNTLHVRAGDHDFKIGGQLNYFDYENFFFFNQQGQFDFDNLDDFENRIPDDYTRNLPNPGPDGLFFTDDDVTPLAVYQTYEIGLYAQDSWHVTDQLTVTGGVRVDLTRFADAAPANTQLGADFPGLRTEFKPADNNISPRLSFTYDPSGTGRTIIRGGGGLFFGRFPSVLYSNSLLNTGANQLNLFCDGDAGEAPTPDYQSYTEDPASIPFECVGGGGASAPIPDVNLFQSDFEYPRTWKASAGFEQVITGNLKVDLDVLYSKTDQNFYVEEANLLPQQFASGVEGRPVFCPTDEISSFSGRCGFGDNRVSSNFDNVLVHTSNAEARTYQVSVGLEQRGTFFSWQLGYTYSDSKDNASYSCCISSTAQFETPTAGSPNGLGDPGDEDSGTWGPTDFSRPHSFVLSGMVNLPYDIAISGIWRAQSGRPWTPIVDGDANGDSGSDNDRAYVGDNLVFDDPAADVATLNSLIGEFDCLADQVGGIAKRNSCRNKMYTQLDLRLRWRPHVYGSHRIEIVADFFNVFNLINTEWSRNVGVGQFSDNRHLLEIEGFDSATNTYTYSVNPSFGEEQDLTAFRTDQGTLQLGVKYSF
jgi:outer membrane receptor for ferrienterochelin and colicin